MSARRWARVAAWVHRREQRAVQRELPLARERQQLRDALEQIAGLDPDEWYIGSGWAAIAFVQQKARAVLAGEGDATPPEGGATNG